MIEVFEKKQIKESCNNCLYGRNGGCANANMDDGKWLWNRIGGFPCQHYWLDQERYEKVNEYKRG